MNKIIDITQYNFDLLKYDMNEWQNVVKELVYNNSPTIYRKYFKCYDLDLNTMKAFYEKIERPEFDKLCLFWQENSEEFKRTLFEIAGGIYKKGITDFGIFLFVGLKREMITFFRTKKGLAMLIDIWYLLGGSNEKKPGEILEVDEITALFTDNYKRIQS
ncbi:MAG TPA: hypothetical protein PLB99_05710 [Thermotogota bacterium]|nr:hypothetical protein [Thermotogota bacterium]